MNGDFETPNNIVILEDGTPGVVRFGDESKRDVMIRLGTSYMNVEHQVLTAEGWVTIEESDFKDPTPEQRTALEAAQKFRR